VAADLRPLTAVATGILPGLVRTARPHQWTKNLLVLAAPAAAGKITEGPVARDTALALVAFCLASAGTYLLNDANDVEADRRHPTKRNRPIAAGIVPVPLAWAVGGVLLVAALVLAFAVATPLGVTIAGYLALTTAYSLVLKRIPIVDIVAVSAGFVLRAVAGAAATDVPISQWFFVVASAGALLMITGKREAELAEVGSGADTRSVLRTYTSGFLRQVRGVATTMALVAYCLWAFEPALTGTGDAGVWFQLSIPAFTVAILRYSQLVDGGAGSEPEKLVLSDRLLAAAGASWAVIYGYAVYVA